MPLTANRHAAGDYVVMEAVLDNPPVNALNPEMARELFANLKEWRDDKQVAAVLLRGAGEKAFCAGGDVRCMHRCLSAGDVALADSYFGDEYRADYALHCFPKPLLCWGDGIVMGGGMGVLQGCDFRIVTSRTKMAMPEAKIGFFPDVGAAFFMKMFNGAPELGYSLGLSGRVFSGEDAMQMGAADFMLPEDSYPKLLLSLCDAQWQDDASSNYGKVRRLIRSMATGEAKISGDFSSETKEIACYKAGIRGDTAAAVDLLLEPERNATQAACPLSLHIWTEYYCRRHADIEGIREYGLPVGKPSAEYLKRLRDTFLSDFILAMNFSRSGEFEEGVRALLVDKDNNPQWRAGYDADAVSKMFESPSPDISDAFYKSLQEIE